MNYEIINKLQITISKSQIKDKIQISSSITGYFDFSMMADRIFFNSEAS